MRSREDQQHQARQDAAGLVYNDLDAVFNNAMQLLRERYPEADCHSIFSAVLAQLLPCKVMEWNGDLQAVLSARNEFLFGCDMQAREWFAELDQRAAQG